MPRNEKTRFSGPVTVFHGLRLPESATPAGYAALIDAFNLKAPFPNKLAAIGKRHRISESPGWRILTPRHAPEPSLDAHLTFALKYEGVDLAVLKRLFQTTCAERIEAIVRSKPTGKYARRIWFLYEWLTGQTLSLPDLDRGNYFPVLDPDLQYAVDGTRISRQRVENNLPGTPSFCPLVFRTEALDAFIASDLPKRARSIIADVPKDVLARTAAFLLLKDSKSSYAIEGESPPQNRIQRWGKAIGEAGRNPIDLDELLRLQEIVIGDSRFVHLGLRTSGGFVGEHERITRAPMPEHISARPEDLLSLIQGFTDFDHGPAHGLDSVIAASIFAFGFVYAHPFEDGNGRIHRYLIHHVLGKKGFNPPGVVFPVSAAMLDRIDEYQGVLRSYSSKILPLIEWEPTPDGNVEVLNDTGDFYRFFDATPHARFLYSCVKQTIERDLPEETDFIMRFDAFSERVQTVVDMPNRTLDLLFRFLHQNNGKLSRRARTREFAELEDSEAEQIEGIYAESFRQAYKGAGSEKFET